MVPFLSRWKSQNASKLSDSPEIVSEQIDRSIEDPVDQFAVAVKNGDAARDQGLWETAAKAYTQAVELRPDLGGYFVQRAHCYKELGNLVNAEIGYRDALAKGVNPRDAWEHLEFCARRSGFKGTLYPLRIIEVFEVAAEFGSYGSATMATLPRLVTSADIRALWSLLIGGDIESDGVILAFLRQAAELDKLMALLVSEPAFAKSNFEMLRVLSRGTNKRS